MAERVFYACQAISVNSSSAETTLPKYLAGIQTASLTSNSDFVQINQFGMIDVLQNLENNTTVECTIESAVLNNRRSLFDIFGKYAQSANHMYFSVYPDITGIETNPYVDSTASVPQTILLDAPYITSFSFNLSTDGFATESVTLSTNSIRAKDGVDLGAANTNGISTRYFQGSGFLRSDAYLRVSGHAAPWTDTSSGFDSNTKWSTGVYYDKLQSVSISLDVGREDLFKLGQKAPYYKAAQFPLETTLEYVIADNYADGGGMPSIDPVRLGANSGVYDMYGFKLHLFSNKHETDPTIEYRMENAVLTSQAKSGGDVGGGVSTTTYSFSSYALLDITYPAGNPGFPAP